jgi:hypothetical protein
MRFKLKNPMTLISKVKGANGVVREFTTVLDNNWPYSYLPKMDALQLGYSAVANRPQEWVTLYPAQVATIVSIRGIEMCTLVSLKEVSVGRLVAKDVQAIVSHLETPPIIPVDVVLGQTFLKNFKMIIDSKAGTLTLK